jgi:hypothetical protein
VIVDVIVHHQSRKYQQLQQVVRKKSSGRELMGLGGLIGCARLSQRMRGRSWAMSAVCQPAVHEAALPSRRREQTGTASDDGVGASAPDI